MYLVFIAMLAINVSPEVLSAFGFLNDDLEEYNESTIAKNKGLYNDLDVKVSDQFEKYRPLQIKLNKIKEISNDYFLYLDSLKRKMITSVRDSVNFEMMSSSNYLDEYFFKGEGYREEGQEFIDAMTSFKEQVIGVLGTDDKGLSKVISSRFDISDHKNLENKTIKWLIYNYKGFPLIASITNITQLQTKAKNTESDILNTLLGNQLQTEVSFSNYEGIVSLDKSAYFAGEKVTGKIVLGRYDPSMIPDKVVLNGEDYILNAKDGQINLDFLAGEIGDNELDGIITYTENGVKIPVPFKSKYSVIPQPTEAVISADKMNVVYRGLDNPISVSLPGVADKDILVTATGLQKVGSGKYLLKPDNKKEVKVYVKATLSSGIVNSNKLFRIKDVPPATAMLRGESGLLSLPRSSISGLTVEAGLPDFVFDLTLDVLSFKIKVPGQLAVIVYGDKMDARAKKLIERSKKGDVINFFEVKAKIKGKSSYQLKKVSNVSVEVVN